MEQPITRSDHARWNTRYLRLKDAAEHARMASEILVDVARDDPQEANAVLSHATDQCSSAAVNIDGLADGMLPQPEAKEHDEAGAEIDREKDPKWELA